MKLSREMRAVLLIFNADSELRRKALPHVNVSRESINWDAVLANDFGGGHGAAVKWAHAIWQDRLPDGADPFDRAFAMNGWLRSSVLKALAMRWGISEQCAFS